VLHIRSVLQRAASAMHLLQFATSSALCALNSARRCSSKRRLVSSDRPSALVAVTWSSLLVCDLFYRFPPLSERQSIGVKTRFTDFTESAIPPQKAESPFSSRRLLELRGCHARSPKSRSNVADCPFPSVAGLTRSHVSTKFFVRNCDGEASSIAFPTEAESLQNSVTGLRPNLLSRGQRRIRENHEATH
jgi:hypothetical protein